MRLLIWLFVASLVAVPVAWRMSGGGAAEGHARRRGPGSVAVEVAPVETAPIRDTVSLTGSLEPRSQFVVAPKVGGRLESLLVEAGDPVKQGQLVAKLDDDELIQQLQQARAEVEVARARVEASRILEQYAAQELKRLESLAARKLVADTELDAARGKLESARADRTVNTALLSQQEAALRGVQVRLDYTEVRALWETEPFERIIGQRFTEEGALLSAGDPIVSILDIDHLEAEVFVIERDYGRIQPGQQAQVSTDAYPGERFPGEVLRIAPLLQETSRQALVEVRVENPDRRLRPGMFVRVRLEIDRREAATVIPQEALVRRNERNAVFVVDREAGAARLVPVEVGIVAEDHIEILSPPLEGDVVTIGHHLLADGGAVTVVPKER